MDPAAGDHRCLEKTSANDNRATAWAAASEFGEAALERLLDIAGAIRFALLLAGI